MTEPHRSCAARWRHQDDAIKLYTTSDEFLPEIRDRRVVRHVDRYGNVSIMTLELIGQGLQAIGVSCGENEGVSGFRKSCAQRDANSACCARHQGRSLHPALHHALFDAVSRDLIALATAD
jgi:hypothetical protein